MTGKAGEGEWFSLEELEAARERYLEEQEQEMPSPEVGHSLSGSLVLQAQELTRACVFASDFRSSCAMRWRWPRARRETTNTAPSDYWKVCVPCISFSSVLLIVHCADLLEREYQVSDCLYWMALTLYGVGDVRASRTHCERLLRMDPSNNKALALHDCIKDVAAKGTISAPAR